MENKLEIDRDGARTAPPEQILVLLHEVRETILLGLVENPAFEENHLCLLLGRKDLSTGLLEEIVSRTHWLRSYWVRRGLAYHPHVPHTVGLRLVRELYLTDLVQLSFLPSAAPELRNLAEELILARLPQLPPAQKMVLARRGRSRIAGALLVDGQSEVVSVVLDSPFLNEGHVLKALSRVALPRRVVAAIADHQRWSHLYSVRLALLRNPQAPLARVLSFPPSISVPDLRVLAESSATPSNLRPHLRRELASRMQHGSSPMKRKLDA